MDTTTLDLYSSDEALVCIKEESELLKFDLLNDSIVNTVVSLMENIDRLSDDEIKSCFVLSSHTFTHPLNCLLSPAALSVAFMNYKLSQLQKPNKDELYYNPKSLPRVTYLSFTGIYSEIDIDVLNAFSENIQTIMVYDEQTGGPDILPDVAYGEGRDFRQIKRHAGDINEKLLLLPMRSYKDRNGKVYNSNDILCFFEEIIFKSIEKFKPSYIVLNCSLNFDPESKNPFNLDPKTLGHIVQVLSQLSDKKVLIYPFKLPDINNSEVQTCLDRSASFLQVEEQRDRFINILDCYSETYNIEYFNDCFINLIETLSDQKEPEHYDRKAQRVASETSSRVSQVRYLIGRNYKNHSYYNFLYSKASAPFSSLFRKQLDNQVRKFNEGKDTVNIVREDGKVKAVKIIADGAEQSEIALDENSQYILDQDNSETKIFYILNAKLIQAKNDLGVKIYSSVCHIGVELDSDGLTNADSFSMFTQFKLDEDNRLPALKDFGICKCEDFVFQVYGTRVGQRQDSNEIFYFDFKEKKHYKVNIKNTREVDILPRHGVTTCAFKLDKTYYLYIFGGGIQHQVVYNGRKLHKLDIIDIVEVYSTHDPTTSFWEYQSLEKSKLSAQLLKSFIPLRDSYAFYDKAKEKIFIMGGRHIKNSITEWTFPVSEFDPRINMFISFKTFINDFKNNVYRKSVQGDNDKRAIPIAIADKNKNFFYDEKSQIFKFLVPYRDNMDYICLYQYNIASDECSFEQVKNEDPSDTLSKIPPPVIKDLPGMKPAAPVRITQQIGYIFNTILLKKCLFNMVNYLYDLGSYEDLKSIFSDYKIYVEDQITSVGNLSISYTAFIVEQITEVEELEVVKESISLLADLLENSSYFRENFLTKNSLVSIKEYLLDFLGKKNLMNDVNLNLELDVYGKEEKRGLIPDFEQNQVPKSDQSMAREQGNKILVDLSENSGIMQRVMNNSNKSIQVERSVVLEGRKDGPIKSDVSCILEAIDKKSLESSLAENIKELKTCLNSNCDYTVFLNQVRSEARISQLTAKDTPCCQTLRFKVLLNGKLEDISFYYSPDSVAIYQGAVVCYIDEHFKKTHTHIYNAYKNCILYANITAAVDGSSSEREPNTLVFKKLFHLPTDENIFKRCLIVNETSLCLFGGKTLKFKGKKTATYQSSQLRYNIGNLKETDEKINHLRDSDVDAMEKNKGECVGVYNGRYIFLCEKNSPEAIETFNNDGTLEACIDLPIETKGFFTHLNLVNFRNKYEVLVTLCALDEDMKFLLYNIESKRFEKKEVTLVPKGNEVVYGPILYSGYEEIQSNNNKQTLDEILIYNYRSDVPQIIAYEIKVKD